MDDHPTAFLGPTPSKDPGAPASFPGIGRPRLRFPRTSADLFQLLALGDSPATLSDLLSSVDYGMASLSLIYHIVHRRPPEFAALVDGADATLAQHLEAAVLSDEFQEGILGHLLAAFPRPDRTILLQRDSATAEEVAGLTPIGYLPLDPALADTSRVSKAAMFQALARIVPLIPHIEGFFLPVEATLAHILSTLRPRPSDLLAMIVDDPASVMVDQANRAIERIVRDPHGEDPAARAVLTRLGLSALPPDPPIATLRDLALRALHDPLICPPNPMCRQLSAGAAADYPAAIDAVVVNDIALIDPAAGAAWHGTRPGPSRPDAPVLSLAAALAADAEQIQASTEQDRIFYEVVQWALRQNSAQNVRGAELVRYAGHRLLDGLPRQILRQRMPDLPDPVMATGPQAAVDFLAAHQQATEIAVSVVCGIDGNAEPYLARGWSGAEPGYIWTNGFRATLGLPRPARPGDYRLRLYASPYVVADRRPFQDVDIAVNGETLAAARLADHAVLDIRLPWPLIATRDAITIDFDLPLATRPADVGDGADTRLLALCLRQLALFAVNDPAGTAEHPAGTAEHPAGTAEPIIMPPDRELMMAFESLGENCEFGLVQRRCGAEPLGLLRFSSAPLPKLTAALRNRFADLGRPDLIEVQVSDNGLEYMVLDRRYGFLSHAWVLTSEKTAEAVHQRECRRLPFLARKLVEDLTEGEKIFVFHGMAPLSEAEARAFAAIVGGYGPATLLWVELADADHPPASVARIGANLLKGHVDRFAPGEDAHDLSLACWIALCRNAYATWKRARPTPAMA